MSERGSGHFLSRPATPVSTLQPGAPSSPAAFHGLVFIRQASISSKVSFGIGTAVLLGLSTSSSMSSGSGGKKAASN